MMKIVVMSISIFWLLLSCNEGKAPNSLNMEAPELSESIVTEILELDSTTILPFGESEISKNEYNPLPTIDSVHYLPLNTGFDFNFNNGQSLKHLKWFNNQLPNVNGYEVYYYEFSCYQVTDSILIDICSGFADLACGFLIFYEPDTRIAHIINIKNSYYIDSGIDMGFRIDEEYDIYLTETGMTDGDVEPDEPMVSETYDLSRHVVEVGRNGEIIITEELME